jgi:uncharacterized small protein (DUF1192 family)
MLDVLAMRLSSSRPVGVLWLVVASQLCILRERPCKAEEMMALFDDEPLKKPKPHEIGQDLSLLSVEELRERIGLLRAEIERLEAELAAKGATKSAAEALFRRL